MQGVKIGPRLRTGQHLVPFGRLADAPNAHDLLRGADVCRFVAAVLGDLSQGVEGHGDKGFDAAARSFADLGRRPPCVGHTVAPARRSAYRVALCREDLALHRWLGINDWGAARTEIPDRRQGTWVRGS